METEEGERRRRRRPKIRCGGVLVETEKVVESGRGCDRVGEGGREWKRMGESGREW